MRDLFRSQFARATDRSKGRQIIKHVSAAVYGAAWEARERAASGGGPTLAEAKCYRFLSHTTDDDDRTYRSRDEVEREPLPEAQDLYGSVCGESQAAWIDS